LSFEWPLALLGLLAVPVLVFAYVRYERRRTASAAQFTNPALLPNLVSRRPGVLRHLPLAVLLAALTALIVGVARPHATVSVPREEATVMLAVDASLSMQANDVKPSRLAAARATATAFVDRVPEKFRVGLVSFTARPFVILPPTTDRDLAHRAIASIRSAQGTALGDAIKLAVQVGQKQRTGDARVPPVALLVISDGAQAGGRTTPEAAAQLARSRRIPVYSIVLGTPNGVVNAKLTGGYKMQIRVPPRPDTLRQIAAATGGKVFPAADDSHLKDVYERLASRLGHKRQSREVSNLFAGGAVVLLLVGGALGALFFRRVP